MNIKTCTIQKFEKSPSKEYIIKKGRANHKERIKAGKAQEMKHYFCM